MARTKAAAPTKKKPQLARKTIMPSTRRDGRTVDGQRRLDSTITSGGTRVMSTGRGKDAMRTGSSDDEAEPETSNFCPMASSTPLNLQTARHATLGRKKAAKYQVGSSGGNPGSEEDSDDKDSDEAVRTVKKVRRPAKRTRTTTQNAGRRAQQIEKAGGRAHDGKKKRRRRPGILVLRDIRRLQSSAKLLIPKLSFSRFVREIAQNIVQKEFKNMDDLRFQAVALQCLQEAAEYFMVSIFDDCNLAAIHGRRVTAMPRDLSLVMKLRNDTRFNESSPRNISGVQFVH